MNEKLYTILDPYLSDQPPFFISIKRYFDFKPLKKKLWFFPLLKYPGKNLLRANPLSP